MHYNTLFQDRNLKNFLRRGTASPQTLPHWGGRNPSPDPTPPHPPGAYGASLVAPSALPTSRLPLSALGFMRPVFSVPIVGNPSLTVTNVVQGKRSQWWKFTGPPNQKVLATPMATNLQHLIDLSRSASISQKHSKFSTLACGHWSIMLWRRCDALCTSGFVSDVMLANNGPD